MNAIRRFVRSDVGWIVAIGVVLVMVQVVATLVTAREIERNSERISTGLTKLQATGLTDEKTRQEVLNLRIQNEIRGYLSNSLLIGIGPIVTAFVALVGVLLSLRNFLEAREKERRDRLEAQDRERRDRADAQEKEHADREKARLDRASAELKDTMDRLVKSEVWQRAAGILGLQHFLSPDLREYHLRAASALTLAARIETDPHVLDAVRVAVEQAVKAVDEDVLQQVTWQRTQLARASLSGRPMRGLDWRDAVLDNADFAASDLTGAVFENAQLRGASFKGATLRDASFAYADLAGARLVGADLTGANLTNAKVAQMDIAGAILRGVTFDPETMPWSKVAHWRKATLDDDLRARLVDQLGDEPSGAKVLMLMWEVPPLVAGGTWTACYHLVRNLRRRGADVTVVVPWAERLVVPFPFGSEVRVVALGITPPELAAGGASAAFSAYGGRTSWSPYASTPSWSPYASTPSWSPYASAPSWSPYAAPSWSPYGAASWSPYASTPSWSPYAWLSASPYAATGSWSPYAASPSWSPYAASPSWSPYGGAASAAYGSYGSASAGAGAAGAMAGPSTLLRLIDECRRLFVRFARSESFDVIHAHDWVTFTAAAAAAKATGKPWIAHFHSLEADRRPNAPDRVIERIERDAAENASALLVPSKVSAGRMAAQYGVDAAGIEVAPNTLSRETIPTAELGLYDTRRTLFLGRLTAQKGPDLFGRIARAVRDRVPGIQFDVRGSGEYVPELAAAGITVVQPVEWEERGRVFADASAVVVPSRAEPFGMVILEAMQHRVPVLYPRTAGAAEVLQSGLRIDPEDIDGTAATLAALLNDRNRWEDVTIAQTREIRAYADRDYEKIVQDAYARLATASAANGGNGNGGAPTRAAVG